MLARTLTVALVAAALGAAGGAVAGWRYTLWRLDQYDQQHARSHASGASHHHATPGMEPWGADADPEGPTEPSIPTDAEIPPERAPTAIAAQARIRPAFEHGRRHGLRITNLRSGFLAEIGVEEGDVLTAINGIRLDSERASLDLLEEIARARDIELRAVGTDGREVELSYP